MFGLLDLFVKRVNDQIAEYAAVQSDTARRIWGDWLDPFHACQPVRVRADRDGRGGMPRREAAHRRQSGSRSD